MLKNLAKKRSLLLIIILALITSQGLLQRLYIFPAWSQNYSTKKLGISEGLSPDHLLLALAGFRELIAGILWTRADNFFHDGNFDAILPIIRLATWLDPNNIDAYSVGMWHIGYNFTDSDNRSDRRYIPSALALGKEGTLRNPHTYELFFELGWTWFHKIDDDYSKAVKWMEESLKHKDIIPGRKALLSNAYLRNGQIDEALNHYLKTYREHQDAYKSDPTFGNKQLCETAENNIDNLLVRMSQRGWFTRKCKTQTTPQFDVGFGARVSIIEPKVIRIEGNWNIQQLGTRIRMILRDEDYPYAIPGGMIWDTHQNVELDPPKNRTFMQDQLYVKNQQFKNRIDLSRDPGMYPLASTHYILEFFYDPRSAPNPIQDRLGWNGEGMTDMHYLNTSIRPGRKVIYAKFHLTRDQILRQGKWKYQKPAFETTGYASLNSHH